MWEVLGLLGVLALWGTLGLVPWSVALIATRGRAKLLGLPIAFAAGMGAGALVPALGAKDFVGLWISLGTAVVGGAVVCAGAAQQTSRLLRKERS